jgi:hypothetical protein
MNQMESIDYIMKNKLQMECNRLANKTGSIYTASFIIANNIPQTEEVIKKFKKLEVERKNKDNEYFEKYWITIN